MPYPFEHVNLSNPILSRKALMSSLVFDTTRGKNEIVSTPTGTKGKNGKTCLKVSPAILKLKELVEDVNTKTLSDSVLNELLQSIEDDRALLLNLEQGKLSEESGVHNPKKSSPVEKGRKAIPNKNITKVTAKPSNRVSKSSIESKKRQRNFQRRLASSRNSNNNKDNNVTANVRPPSTNNSEHPQLKVQQDCTPIEAVVAKSNPRLLRTNSVDNDSKKTVAQASKEGHNATAPPDPVAQLSNSMGFPRSCVEIALKRCDGDLERAVNDLLTNMATLEDLVSQNAWRDRLNSGDSVDVQANGGWVEGVILERNKKRNLIFVQFLNREQWFRCDTKRLAKYKSKSRDAAQQGIANVSAPSSPMVLANNLNVDDESNYWIEYVDESTQSPYYYNTRTHVSTWEKPDCFEASDMPT